MEWSLEEAAVYYQKQGAPSDQPALLSLLKEIQQSCGGGIPAWALTRVAELYGVKETYLLALIRRIGSLRLTDTHCLEVCAGPNCRRHREISDFLERLSAEQQKGLTIRYTSCMRMCGKGPNIRWDGRLYHAADVDLIRSLLSDGMAQNSGTGKK